MSNKVYISNKIARIKNAEEAARMLEEEGRRQLIWGIKKDRDIPNKETKEEPEQEEKDN